MGYKCKHGRSHKNVADAVQCDLAEFFMDKYLSNVTKPGSNFDKLKGPNGLPLFEVFENAELTNSLPVNMLTEVVKTNAMALVYFCVVQPDMVEDLIAEGREIHKRLSGFNAEEAIKTAAAKG